MIRTEDIDSLTEFSQNMKANLKRLKRTGRPELLTVNGKAEVVIQSASAYQRLMSHWKSLAPRPALRHEHQILQLHVLPDAAR